MHEENNHLAKFIRSSSNESHDSAKVFLFETEKNHSSNETVRTKKIITFVGILAIVFTLVAIVAIVLSSISSVDRSPKNGKWVEKFGKAFAFYSKNNIEITKTNSLQTSHNLIFSTNDSKNNNDH